MLCKDADGKVGVRVHAINNGVFVCLVSQNSPAAMGGLRFGDQILTINDVCVAGYSMDQVHKLLRNANTNGIKVVVRDRSVCYFLFIKNFNSIKMFTFFVNIINFIIDHLSVP